MSLQPRYASVILTLWPVTHEFVTQAKTEPITLTLLVAELPKFHLCFPDNWHLTAVVYNLTGAVNFTDKTYVCTPMPEEVFHGNEVVSYYIRAGSTIEGICYLWCVYLFSY